MVQRNFVVRLMVLAALVAAANHAQAFPTPLGNAFTYQGQLKQSGSASTGAFDFECKLFDALNAGTQIGTTQTITNVTVTAGLFTIDLDFGAGAFDGNDRFLQLGVRTAGGGTFTTLTPRQKLNTAPYAQFAKTSVVSGTIGNQVSFTNAANSFVGSGANLTGLNASNITSGSLAGSILLGAYTNALTFNNPGNSFTGSGAGLTGLNAGNITAGTLGIARLPSGGAWTLTSILNLDSNTLAIDPVNNRVGVGTAAPSAALHVFTSSAGTIPLIGTSSLVLERNGAHYISILSPDSSESGLRFGQPTLGNAAGQILFNPAGSIDGFMFTTGAGGQVTIESNGDMGIGTTTPEQRVHIFDGSAGTVTANSAAALVIESSTSGWINLLTPDGVQRGILFGDPTNAAAGGIIYDSGDNNSFQFRTNGNVTRMTLDDVGNLGIGTGAPDVKLHVTGGSDASPTGGGFIVAGPTTGANLVIDDNEIMARNNGVASTLLLNNNGGDVSVSPGGTGKLITPVIEITGADLAEEFPFSEVADPGTVVAIDAEHPGQLCVARGAYNRAVAGIVAGANDFHTGAVLGRKSGAESGRPVALNGRVYVRATNANGEIRPGDLLTTSDAPGLAMKATDADRMAGAILGKAMTSIDPHTGFVLVLVNLH